MSPYYAHDCVTYYSPNNGFIPLLSAFAVGAIVGTLWYATNSADNKHEHPLNVDEGTPQEQIVVLENRLNRAFHVIVGLLILLWLIVVTLIVQNHNSLHAKTEL